MAADGLFVGLMSGTSIDGIDAVLARIEGGNTTLVATHSQAYPADLGARLREAAGGIGDDLATLGRLDRAVARAFAGAARGLLDGAGVTAEEVIAIGSHGQTVRHEPGGAERFSLQIGDPSTIAEETGIQTVADFRRRDIAAGGEGAPLVPAFHAAAFGLDGERRAIVNIGGIANVTLLDGTRVVAGFDCGPGNTLLDGWIHRHRGEAYDSAGAWSAEHAVDDALLERLGEDSYLARRGPRSTGPEHFNLTWLEARLHGDEAAGDVQATLCEFTARVIAGSLAGPGATPQGVYVCGGGARNTDLMRRLHRALDAQGIRLGTTDEIGMAAEWVEAAAFAWLAQRRLAGLPGNCPAATGAKGDRVLGGVYAA